MPRNGGAAAECEGPFQKHRPCCAVRRVRGEGPGPTRLAVPRNPCTVSAWRPHSPANDVTSCTDHAWGRSPCGQQPWHRVCFRSPSGCNTHREEHDAAGHAETDETRRAIWVSSAGSESEYAHFVARHCRENRIIAVPRSSGYPLPGKGSQKLRPDCKKYPEVRPPGTQIVPRALPPECVTVAQISQALPFGRPSCTHLIVV